MNIPPPGYRFKTKALVDEKKRDLGPSCLSLCQWLHKKLERWFGQQGWDFSIALASMPLTHIRHFPGWELAQTQCGSSTRERLGTLAQHGGAHM